MTVVDVNGRLGSIFAYRIRIAPRSRFSRSKPRFWPPKLLHCPSLKIAARARWWRSRVALYLKRRLIECGCARFCDVLKRILKRRRRFACQLVATNAVALVLAGSLSAKAKNDANTSV